MDSEKIIVEDRGPVWHVRINAPERRNALGMAVVTGLLAVAERVAEARTVRAVILSGRPPRLLRRGRPEGRQGMPEPEVRAFVGLLNRTFDAIAASPKVWIAAIHGVSLGGGWSWPCAATCASPARAPSWGCPRPGWASCRGRRHAAPAAPDRHRSREGAHPDR
ncbi:MAG: enoyl-CoA hydratase/isomerase family protein [bacterium]